MGPDPEPDDEDDDVEDDVVDDEDVVVDEEEDEDTQDSLIDATASCGRFAGNGICESGVPGGTLTLNVNCWPPTNVTITLHVSAEATGIDARPKTTSATLAATHATNSFRVLSTVLQFLQPLPRRSSAPRGAA